LHLKPVRPQRFQIPVAFDKGRRHDPVIRRGAASHAHGARDDTGDAYG
jgi:hypothetical protein